MTRYRRPDSGRRSIAPEGAMLPPPKPIRASNLHGLTPSPWDELATYQEATEFERDDLLDDVTRGLAVSVVDSRVLVRTPLGGCVVRVETVRDCPIVLLDHVRTGDIVRGEQRWIRRTFWFNKHSVTGLGDKLRALPRRPWTDLLMEVVL